MSSETEFNVTLPVYSIYYLSLVSVHTLHIVLTKSHITAALHFLFSEFGNVMLMQM